MIILTPELAELRIEARKIFPNHTWLPGDDCPSGTKVIRANGERATVLREIKPGTKGHEHTEYWWEIELEKRFPPNFYVPTGILRVLEWPPMLRKA